jgi:hypothetical protein
VKALQRMSQYLSTLRAFDLKADTIRDVVTAEGQRIQLAGVSRYIVRAPNAFQVDISTDLKERRFYYDGQRFTVFAPKLGYYASAPAPPTIRGALEALYDRFGIVLPLEDLFRWNESKDDRSAELKSAFLVGPGTVDGVVTDHYAFRQAEKDWEIWIDRGARPLPRKLVIVDRSDPAAPGYSARMTWNTAPSLSDVDFAFKPGPNDKLIHLAELKK